MTVSVDRTGAVELTNTASGAVVGFVPSVPVPGSMAEFLPADVLTPQDVAAIEQGRDLGDETGPLKYIP